MPAFVSLSSLSWSTPDGTPLFNDLNLTFGPERTGIVGRNGIGKSTLLRLISGEMLPASGQVQVSGAIAMMRQDAMEQPDDTIADLFDVRPALDLLNRAEAGLADTNELADADWPLPARIEAALLRCGLSAEPQTHLVTLSGGQRSRAALAALVLAEPDFLLLDEPTNNLDRDGRRAMIELIRGWTGGAIIVSHDRELLEEMDAIIELTSLGATRYGGNYSTFRHRKAAELDTAARDLAHAEKSSKDIARRAQRATERKARKNSAGHKARAKGDQPKILMDAAKGRAEASGGAGARLRDARRVAADEVLSAAREKIEVLQPLRMDIPPTGLAPGRTVLRLNGVTGGYDPAHPVINDLSLAIAGPERIVIAGPNGSGKTTLLALIAGQIVPQRGLVDLMVPFALLDQHVALLDPARTLRENFLHLNPAADAHAAHAALARFGFRAGDALRRTDELSGGERLRAGLACALGATPPPMLLMLDEPTNHLDLDGIAALEAALKAYDGAVLVISHDEAFLRSLAPDRTIHLRE
ncbi:ABC-F family ATP-binding cassette domain-containing protein [Rhodopseudomonas pseudopalustris]|uniref:ATPase components of ABC transporters with duplicated ATPase domains n=1 Tax=Rhodopseudomonas pseudopalustris TaxID=1513892 RepID=A0A1H8W8P7_9BRAD|nr:ABC-F family ATP-binding cassette domain-containing protein [Rhodopseudomonas pseudopalustris]MBB1091532.1 ABC-F family ATP-binding cassette domain-containing protein [Rhodopseudomonas palustris]SEP24010.1 ATPase components of ABC transporters with duplicated ATPase domains [Rhodopseudomonas pseudopalustris]